MTNAYPINPALQPFVNIAGNSTALINAADNALLYGRMTPEMRSALMTALPAMYDNNQRVLTVLYLTAMSGDYLIQH
jgi:fatty acid/phospholipid biosynthesis enzyme